MGDGTGGEIGVEGAGGCPFFDDRPDGKTTLEVVVQGKEGEVPVDEDRVIRLVMPQEDPGSPRPILQDQITFGPQRPDAHEQGQHHHADQRPPHGGGGKQEHQRRLGDDGVLELEHRRSHLGPHKGHEQRQQGPGGQATGMAPSQTPGVRRLPRIAVGRPRPGVPDKPHRPRQPQGRRQQRQRPTQPPVGHQQPVGAGQQVRPGRLRNPVPTQDTGDLVPQNGQPRQKRNHGHHQRASGPPRQPRPPSPLRRRRPHGDHHPQHTGRPHEPAVGVHPYQHGQQAGRRHRLPPTGPIDQPNHQQHRSDGDKLQQAVETGLLGVGDGEGTDRQQARRRQRRPPAHQPASQREHQPHRPDPAQRRERSQGPCRSPETLHPPRQQEVVQRGIGARPSQFDDLGPVDGGVENAEGFIGPQRSGADIPEAHHRSGRQAGGEHHGNSEVAAATQLVVRLFHKSVPTAVPHPTFSGRARGFCAGGSYSSRRPAPSPRRVVGQQGRSDRRSLATGRGGIPQ